ncbi:MAG: NHL repeat-containing protein [Chloroherpetonaceae bacterium]|nr:NHL repeat-containing protein [Chloroherpetonaceae bacterium]
MRKVVENFAFIIAFIGCIFISNACNQPVTFEQPVFCLGDSNYVASTVAGNGTLGFVNGAVENASFNNPYGITIGNDGVIYVSDNGNHVIRKILPTGVVQTLSGNGSSGSQNGLPDSTRFNSPIRLAVDSLGNVYVADFNNNVIRKVTPDGVSSVYAGSGVAGFADGDSTQAQFYSPAGICLAPGLILYVTDFNGHRVRKITPDRKVTTYAGSGISGFADGIGISAQFLGPSDVAIDKSGNLYVSEFLSNRIRKISPDQSVRVFAGGTSAGFADGSGSSAQFNSPDGITVDSAGAVWVCDRGNNLFRKISLDGRVSTIAGCSAQGFSDGRGKDIRLNAPRDVAIDANGNFIIADGISNRIRKIQFSPL